MSQTLILWGLEPGQEGSTFWGCVMQENLELCLRRVEKATL